MVFFFKQKTAYEMRISDWSSDVCSSDLVVAHQEQMIRGHLDRAVIVGDIAWPHVDRVEGRAAGQRLAHDGELEHRAAVRVAGDEPEEARIGAGEIGVDRDRQHRRHLAPDRLPVDDQRTLSQIDRGARSEENTSELPSLMRNSYD